MFKKDELYLNQDNIKKKDNNHGMSIGTKVALGVTGGLVIIGSLIYGGNKEPKLDIRHTEGLPEGSIVTHVYAPINGTVLEVKKYTGESSDSSNLGNGEWSCSSLFEFKYLPRLAKDSTDVKTEDLRGQVIMRYDTLNKKLEK